MRSSHSQRGQATVELVAVLPVLVLVGLVLWQGTLAGQALWLAGSAARAGARAQAVGGDARRAVRARLPRRLERGLEVRGDEDGQVRVAVRVPSLVGAGGLFTVRARARFLPQGT